MAFNESAQTRPLKLPPILENIARLERADPILSTRCEVSHLHQLQRCPSVLENQSVNPGLIETPTIARRITGGDFGKIVPEHKRSFHQILSPDSEFRYSSVDEGHSTATTSPYSGMSQARSTSCSSTGHSYPGEDSSDDGPKIGSMSVKDFSNEIDDIIAEIHKNMQREKASDSKEQHKNDEKCRRAAHKILQKLAEKACCDQLARLKNPNTDIDMEDLDSQTLRVMMTGNNKKEYTKTAVYIAQLLKHKDEAEIRHRQNLHIQILECTIQTLKCAIQDAGLPMPNDGGSDFLASLANKRRKS